MSISNPRDGSILLFRPVEINGTARGSQVEWQEALKEDFDAGTLENLTNDAAGTLSLNHLTYDTFDGAEVDPARWTASEGNGLTAAVSGGSLQLSGQGGADGWASAVQLVSTAAVSNRINGTLRQLMEVGTGAYSVIGLWQDDRNFIAVGRAFDFFGLGPGQHVALVTSASGCFTIESLGAITLVPHTFTIAYNGTSATFYMDGSELVTRSVTLSAARCLLRAAVNATGDFISAVWDDVSCLYATSGRFTSAVQDTLSAAPELSGVTWTANLPAGLSLAVRLRSADNPAMQGASGWVDVTQDQSSGFPAFRQYLQYSVLFTSPAGNATSLFRDITVRYICAVKMVDVSVDNRTTWQRAMGKENWTIRLDIPDGPCRVWARVTDVTGEPQLAWSDIQMDTTEPTASLVINEGTAMTPRREVNLTLAAFDAYGVLSMIVSEDELFSGAEWQPYNLRFGWNLSAGDGPKTVHARVRDANGWESPVASASVTLDTLPPAGTVRINNGGTYTRSSTVTLHLNASDASGVSEMLLSNRGDFSGDEWLPYVPIYSWNLQPGNGIRTVYARFRDPSGHMSVPVSATVTLDTVLPEFSFRIENGSTYALSYDVELELNATDNNALGEMLVSSNPQFGGATWEPWAPTRRWTIASGEGPATLYSKVRDAAENEAPSGTASVIVDTVAPVCIVSSLPATTASASFTVAWNGNDATSGILGYDVQYREGTGPWTDWKLLVTNTTAVFDGQDGRTYTFRARARDLAGNVGTYPENPKTSTTVKLPGPGIQLPVVSVLTPQSSAPYKGKVRFEGTARALAPGRSIAAVQWQVDDGAWLNAAGNESWSFEWDTAGASRGPHTLRVRSFDGTNYSLAAERAVRVDNPAGPSGGGTDMTAVLLVLVVVAVAGALGGVLVMRRRKQPAAAPGAAPAFPSESKVPGTKAPLPAASASEEEEPAGEESGEPLPAGTAPAGEPAEAAPAAPGEAAGAAQAPGAAPEQETAGGAPPSGGEAPPAVPPLQSAPRPPLELVRQVDPAKILAVVRAIHPSLPGELQFMSPEDITGLVVTGEQGKSKFGEPLVVIMGRWYFADEAKPTFLQRYNW